MCGHLRERAGEPHRESIEVKESILLMRNTLQFVLELLNYERFHKISKQQHSGICFLKLVNMAQWQRFSDITNCMIYMVRQRGYL